METQPSITHVVVQSIPLPPHIQVIG